MMRLGNKNLPPWEKTPYRQWIYKVTMTSLVPPAWARKLQPADFDASDSQVVWVPRFAANLLMKADTEDGGKPTVTKVQWCRCPVCHRLMVGVMAERRRRLNASYAGRTKTCDQDCQVIANLSRKRRPK